MDNKFGTKELYNVQLKATYLIEIGNRVIQPNEVVLEFDNIQMSALDQLKSNFVSTGGYNNEVLVNWEETKEVRFNFTQGKFSIEQLALLTNAFLIENDNNSGLTLSQKEFKTNDGNGVFTLLHNPIEDTLFIYDQGTGSKLTDYTINGNILTLDSKYSELFDLLIRYDWTYNKSNSIIKIGRAITNGYLALEGRMRLKDDNTGLYTTGIVKIPKLKLMSDLSMRLGTNQSPFVMNFQGVGYPVGDRSNKTVCDIIILDDDIDSDIN